jgi:indole-3-glycerol phosphate synthase
VLLIASALEGSRLSELVDFAISQELDPLVEVHDATELKRAVSTRARMIGINQRDLTTFELDLSLAIDLRPSVPTDRVVIAESGVNTPDQVRELAEANLDAVLMGESLLRSDDLALAVRAMIAH